MVIKQGCVFVALGFVVSIVHTFHALGIDAVHWNNFQSTTEMYPVVKQWLTKCEDAKDDMHGSM